MKKEKKTISLLRKGEHLIKQHQNLQRDFDKLNKNFSDLKEKYNHLCQEREENQEELSDLRYKLNIEKHLTKQTYAYLYSEGYQFDYQKNRWQRMIH